MPQLLIELFSEEIPARMQRRAEEDFARALMDKLSAAGLLPEAVKTFSGPRRIAAIVEGLPARTPDVSEERKGPRVGAPENAVQGFLRGAGLTALDQAQIVEDKKGAFYVARIEKKGRDTPELIQEIVPEIIKSFPWPKSMRSGVSDLQWVRPLHNIACVFDGAEVAISVDGVASRAETRGHRFHAPAAFSIKGFDDYAHKLQRARVMIDREERKAVILGEAKTLCAARDLELVEDPGLLDEVAGLVEWPVPLMGDMDPNFLSLPGEVIRLSMRTHQKYFAVRDPKTGRLAPHFITVANIEAKDGGRAIAAGNARVLSARLNDARFFWDGDRKTPLYTEERREKLKQIVFHQKLGSVWDKVERVKALAIELCAATGADPKRVEEAALRCKMDLVTETVGEFPELQGQVGRQLYALEKDADASIAAAIEDHYRPLGPSDYESSDAVAVTLAIADKLFTLAAFWVVGEKSTGSSDPYALRRAALGLIRTVLEDRTKVPLISFTEVAMNSARDQVRAIERSRAPASSGMRASLMAVRPWPRPDSNRRVDVDVIDLLAFLADRLKVQLRDQGKRHDLVDAVFALGDDDLVRIVARVEALDAFLKTEDGANLLAGYRRAANIVAAEEKKGKGLSEADAAKPIDEKLLAEPAEKALYAALVKAAPAAKAAVEKEDFAAAMGALSSLRAPVDAFFEAVLVNAEEAALRRNRLKLLLDIRAALHAVADFSKIEG